MMVEQKDDSEIDLYSLEFLQRHYAGTGFEVGVNEAIAIIRGEFKPGPLCAPPAENA
jgi:hypothetical protein